MTPLNPQVWYAVGLMTAVNVLLCVGLVAVKFHTVRRAVRKEMGAAVAAISRRLDASEIFLTAAEQHTAHQEVWEKRRTEEHDRRQREHVRLLQKLIRDEIGRQLKLSELKVVSEVKAVPDVTADKVVERTKPGAADSHHG